MLQLTISAAALAMLAAFSGPALAAEPMSAAEYKKALATCRSSGSTAERDDCVKAARDSYESGVGTAKPADGKDAAKQVSDKLPDKKMPDDKDLAKDTVSKTVPDKLKN